MFRLLRYLKKYWLECFFGPFFKLLEASFDLLVPLIMKMMIDEGIGKQNMPYVWKMGGILLALALVGFACSVSAQYFAAKAATGFSSTVRRELFAKMERLSFQELEHLGQSSLMTRLTNDVQTLQTGVNLTLRLFLRSPFIIVGAMIAAYFVSGKVGMVFVIVVPIVFLFVFLIMLWTIPKYRKVQSSMDDVVLSTRENLFGVRVIRAFSKEEAEIKKYQKKNEIWRKIQSKVGAIAKLLNPLSYGLIYLSIVWILYLSGVEVEIGAMTKGDVIAVVNYMTQIVVELIKFADLVIQMTKAIASGDRIAAMLDLPEDVMLKASVDEKEEGKPWISFEDVWFSYHTGGEEAISHASFSVNKGEMIGVIGGTGSGKSTLISLLAGFYLPSKGHLFVAGKNIEHYSREEIRHTVTVVLQKSQMFHGTIRENLCLGRANCSIKELQRALEISQGKEFVEEKPGGLDFMLEQGGKNLSGGQKQRLAIARGILGSGEILVLDDASSALDYKTEANLKRALKELKDRTIFLVSQRASTMMGADRILVLDDGEIVGFDTHEQLLKTCEIYREIYESQTEEEA